MKFPAAVLFDMDGTLIDTEPLWMESEFELVAEHGGTWTHADALSIVGFGLRSAARVLREHGVDLEVDDLVHELSERVAHRLGQAALPWRPGAKELLVECRAEGIPTALVTMSWRKLTDAAVAGMMAGGVDDPFDVTICGDEVPASKPEPDPYLLAAAKLGVDPSQCLAIEDSPTGTASACAAGCRTIGVAAHAPLEARPGLTVLPTLDGVTLDGLVALL